jgi:carbonic anhydrase/acetyltransferase-like protein (isoleucine patch superfamily)
LAFNSSIFEPLKIVMNKFSDKHRIYLFLPLLLIPFLALAFHALGGGRAVDSDLTAKPGGINAKLPEAQFKKIEPANKIGFYNQSGADTSAASLKLEELSSRMLLNRDHPDQQAAEVQQRLSALNQELSRPLPLNHDGSKSAVTPSVPVNLSGDVSRLERLMKDMEQSTTEQDPEMTQLNSMMDKILEIQRPRTLGQSGQLLRNSVHDSAFVAIRAVIAENQKVSEGSVVKLRLLDTIMLAGQQIPKGQLLFGLAAFTNQRLNLEIKNVRLGNSIVPVNLTVFDRQDAMIGINVPEAVLQDAVNLSASNAAGNIRLLAGDQPLGLQAAGAGLDAAKNMFSKKLRRLKVKLNAGYPLLLRNNTRRNP